MGNYDWEVDISMYIRTGELFLKEHICTSTFQTPLRKLIFTLSI